MCKHCRESHFKAIKSDIMGCIKKMNAENEVLFIQEVDSVAKHEQNVTKCKQIREIIECKVNELIARIKNEESKLLEKIDEFEQSENNLVTLKSKKLKELDEMKSFCSTASNILNDKDETDKEVMDMKKSCDSFTSSLISYSNESTGVPRKLYFNGREHNMDDFSLGNIEIISQIDFMTSTDENYDDKPDSLEIHLAKPRRQTSATRRNRNSTSIAIKLNTKQVKPRNIIEPARRLHNFKIIGREGLEEGEFRHPLGIAISPIDGNIYVADSWNSRIQIFDDNGNFVRAIKKPGSSSGEFHHPYAIHINKNGRIYVSDQSQARIKVFDSQFNLVSSIGQYGKNTGCYSGLCDLSTDEENNVYICDSGNHRIIKFNEKCDFILEWGENGTQDGQFKCPACICVHQNRVIVSDWGNHRVQIFSLDGKFIQSIGQQGSGLGELKRPLGIAVDDSGNIAIVDEGNNRIQLFKCDLTFHSKISGLKCGFQRPWDIAITKTGKIVVSEYYGHRLQIF